METNTNDLIQITISINGKAFLNTSRIINSDADLARFNSDIQKILNMLTADRVSRWYPTKGT
jgi:hypothetical protein